MDNNGKIELLTEAGEAAYGKNWKTELANIFGINERTVRYWATGERTVPTTMIRGMISHLRDRADIMHRVADHLARELRYSDEYAELKTTALIGLSPAVSSPDIAEPINWFDVDGYIYGVDKNNRVIDRHGNDATLKNSTLDELHQARFNQLKKSVD